MSELYSPTNPEYSTEPQLILASASQRLLAYLIDVLPLTAAITALFYYGFGFDHTVAAHWADKQNTAAAVDFYVQRNLIRNLIFVVYIIYSALLESSPTYSGSLGKRLLGLRVVDEYGEPVTAKQAWGRNLTKLISFVPLFLGAFWILFDKRNQAWHDKAAKTLVVQH